MEVWKNFKEYKKHKPSYKSWEENKNLDEAKRQSYLAKNNVSDSKRKEDIERAKVVLNAVNVMDEFSQTRAEDAEVMVQTVTQPIQQLSGYAGMFLGGSTLLFKSVRNAADDLIKNKNFKQLPKLIPTAILFITPAIISSIILEFFSVKKETQASRLGRAHAMRTQLNSANQFAVLTDEQKAEVEKNAKDIKVTKKEAKNFNKASGGIIESFKTLFKNKENDEIILETNKQFKSDKSLFDNPLSAEEIEEAKKDKQLIQNIVRKVDIASQDYAENVELATDVASVVCMGSGGIVGYLTNFLLGKLKVSAKTLKIAPVVIGSIIAFGGTIYATRLQKESSRVARWKVKNEFLENPQMVLYADEEKYKNENVEKDTKKKKENIFKFLLNAIKDDKEYKKYVKENNEKQLKIAKAKDKIKLTPEQEKRAKQLQKNTFKMFNTLDEKSQQYSESTEAVGGVVQQFAGLFAMIPGLYGFTKNTIKGGNYIHSMISLAAALAPPIIMNILVTKEQKQASRVASMLAINELDDYRHFADYSNSTTQQNVKKELNSLTPPWKK